MNRNEPPASPSQPSAAREVRIGDLIVDTARERVSRNGQDIPLPPLSFSLLMALARNAPDFVSVRRLLDEVWPDAVVGTEAVSQRVKLLRVALQDDPRSPRYIEGARGRGYRLISAREETSERDIVQAGDGSAADPSPSRGGPSPRNPPRSRWLLASLAAAAIFATVIATHFMRDTRPTTTLTYADTRDAHGLADAPVRLAVLPLRNLSPDPANAYFTDGMHEIVISALAQLSPRMEVISRTTMLTYDTPRTVEQIARELRATHLIEGSVLRDEQQARVSLQLIDAQSQAHLWAHEFDGSPERVPALQSEIATRIAAQLSISLPHEGIVPHAFSQNAQANDLYIRALLARSAASFVYSSPEALDAIEEPLVQALELEPDFAHAHAELSAVRTLRFAMNIAPGDDQALLAEQTLLQAERLARDDPKVLAARGLYEAMVDQDFKASLTAYRTAIAAGLADPVWLITAAHTYTSLGLHDQALQLMEHTYSIDPRNSVAITGLALQLMWSGRPVESLQLLDRSIPELPRMSLLPLLRAHLYFFATGELEPITSLASASGYSVSPAEDFDVDDGEALRREASLLRYGGRFPELKALLDAFPKADVRSPYFGAGNEPVAAMRGWANLLAGDTQGAARAGREVLHFLANSRETFRNRHLRRMWEAEAHTFLRQPEQAVAAAIEALSLQPWQRYDGGMVYGATLAAVLAWNGASHDAINLLEELATNVPGPAPAMIAREPLFAIPLADNPQFQLLSLRLEASMRATRASMP